jgi:GTP-binding protein
MRATDPAPEVSEKAEGSGRSTRSERRAPKKKPEPPPRHSLVLMDMPGYGLNSQAEWGIEIAKYLGRRAMLRGAVLLVDAVAGLKNGDRMVLKMLRDADVRTAVVLTKADKLGYGSGDHGERAVKKMCLNVWQELRDMERGSMTWLEGKGWEREIWVTGAGDPKNGGVGVEGARLAICRMAGLVEDNRVFDVPELNPTGKIVPFDQLQWAAPSIAPRVDAGRLLGRPNRASF